MQRPGFGRHSGIASLLSVVAIALAACGSAAGSGTPPSALSSNGPLGAPASLRDSTSPSVEAPTDSPTALTSETPEGSASTAAGDIPDNAVFLRFTGGTPPFSIHYVEGWQVTPQPDGVVIRDKDSSETVAIVGQTDAAGYVKSTDLPGLQAQAGFRLVRQDAVKVGSATYVHLVYHLPAPPDPVTGKRVPSTIDRYYVPGPGGLAVISLSTPDGVDNVDAFREMITSFKWT